MTFDDAQIRWFDVSMCDFGPLQVGKYVDESKDEGDYLGLCEQVLGICLQLDNIRDAGHRCSEQSVPESLSVLIGLRIYLPVLACHDD